MGRVGQPDREYHEYPGAYHVLVADRDGDRVLADIERWIGSRL